MDMGASAAAAADLDEAAAAGGVAVLECSVIRALDSEHAVATGGNMPSAVAAAAEHHQVPKRARK